MSKENWNKIKPVGKPVVMSGEGMLCPNCGDRHVFNLPIAIPAMTALMYGFAKRHEQCKPEWEQPKPDERLGYTERLHWWLTHGRRGASAETIFHVFSPIKIRYGKGGDFPRDTADFYLCYELLALFPQWRENIRLKKFELIEAGGPEWYAFADKWDELSYLLEQETAGQVSNGTLAEEISKIRTQQNGSSK